jgi:hypothetical protein
MRKFTSFAAAFVLAPAVFAGDFPKNGFYYGVEASVEHHFFLEEEFTDNSLPINFNENVAPWGTLNGMAHVTNAGVNKARMAVNLASTVEDEMTAAHAMAFADWWDTITISDPDLNGTTGTFTATMLVNGAGAVTATGPWIADEEAYISANWAAWIGVSDDGFKYVEDGWGGGWENNPLTGGFDYDGDPLGQMQTEVEFEFTFGEPFYLEGRLQTFFFVDNFWGTPGSLEGLVDLGNSAYWGGIQTVRDRFGNLVTDHSITSGSGVNWGASIHPGALQGDFNADNIVNIGDFSLLASNFNRNVTNWTNGDATGDGVVRINDFAILAANFNQNVSRAAVPEPGFGFIGLAVLGLRRRH